MDVAVPQLPELLVEGLHGKKLDGPVESALSPLPLAREQHAGHVGGERHLGPDPVGAAEGLGGERCDLIGRHRRFRPGGEPHGPARHGVGRRPGGGDERGEDERLRFAETRGVLVEKPARRGGDPLQLSPERDEVQVGLEDLALGPAPLQCKGRRDLTQLLPEVSLCAAGRRGCVEARGELHADGACAAGPARGDMAQDRHAEGSPVDAAVLVETPVFGRNDGTGERRRDVRERNPLQAPPRRVHAHLVDDAAVPVQEQRIGEPVRSAHFLKGWKQRPGEIQSDDDSAQEGGAADQDGCNGELPSFYRQTNHGSILSVQSDPASVILSLLSYRDE